MQNGPVPPAAEGGFHVQAGFARQPARHSPREMPTAFPAGSGGCADVSSWSRGYDFPAAVPARSAGDEAVPPGRPSFGDACAFACHHCPVPTLCRDSIGCQDVRRRRLSPAAGSLPAGLTPRGSCRYACVCHDGNLAFPGCQYGRTPHRMTAESRSKGLPRSISMSPRKISLRVAAGLFKFRCPDCNSGRPFRQTFFTEPAADPLDKKISHQVFAPADLLVISRLTEAVGHSWTAARLLGNRLTVDPRTLTPLVLVRIQVPQPFALNSCKIYFFRPFISTGVEDRAQRQV